MFALVRRSGANLASRASNAIRNSHGHAPPKPGDDLPFDITNRYKLTLYFALFLGSGFSIPFLSVRHHMLKP